MNAPFGLAGRRALVVGAGGSIGEATARLLARMGADLTVADLAVPEAL